MDLSCFIFGLIFFACGISIGMGKLHVFIPYWKNLSEEEKKEIEIKPLCFNVGIIIGSCGLIFILSGLFTNFRAHFFLILSIIWIVVACLDIVYIEKSNRYKRNKFKEVKSK